MNVEAEVLSLINRIIEEMKKMRFDAEKVFLNGDCGNLYTILARKFPNMATPYLVYYQNEPYHILTKINEKFYDITGETTLEKYINYVKEHNYYRHGEDDFRIEKLPKDTEYISKMSNQYEVDENYEESIADSAIKLLEIILSRR